MQIDLITAKTIIIDLLLFFLMLFIIYAIFLIIEIRKSFKISNSMLSKIEEELTPNIALTSELLQDLTGRIKAVLNFLDILGEGVGKAKDQVIENIKPSKASFLSLLTGIRQGLNVISKGRKKKKG